MRAFYFIVLLFFSAILLGQSVNVTVVGDEAYPPYSYREGREMRGIYVEILKRAFAKMPGYNVKIVPMPWKRGLKGVETGDIFAIFPPYKHPGKRPFINPYSVPIVEETVIVMCRDEVLSKKRTTWPEDFYGLKIGVNTGFSIGGDKFIAAVKQGKIKRDESKTNDQNLMKLGVGRIDCYLNDRIAILTALKNLKKKGAYKEGGSHAKLKEGVVVNREWGYLGLTDRDKGKFKFKNDFLQKFNKVIEEMKNSGEIRKIIETFTK